MSDSRITLSEMEIDRLSKKLSMETGKSYEEARYIITCFVQETKPLGGLCSICMKNEKIKGLDYCNDCRKSYYDTCKKINHAFDSDAKLPDAEFFERLDKEIKENDKIVYELLYNRALVSCKCPKCHNQVVFKISDIQKTTVCQPTRSGDFRMYYDIKYNMDRYKERYYIKCPCCNNEIYLKVVIK